MEFAKYCVNNAPDAEVPSVGVLPEHLQQLKACVCLLQLLISQNWEYNFDSAKVYWNPETLRSAKYS